LMIVPKDNCIQIIPLGTHQFDVIPDESDPEKAYAYIINVWNLDMNKSYREPSSNFMPRYSFNDQMNQVIADDSDRKAELDRYVVWTKDEHFTMDGNGKIVTEVKQHIGMLPFVDIATEKDFQFFVRRGSSITQFAIDFGLACSDLANINRLQGYSQAIIYATQMPTDVVVGPERILFLPMDANSPDSTPKFEFASPSPDLKSGLELLETQLKLFLASRGQEPSSISSTSGAQKYSSGIERLLAMLDKFEASRSDFDLFADAEEQAFQIMKAWSNLYQGVQDETRLKSDLNITSISDDVYLEVKFVGPETVQSEAEILDNTVRQLEIGLMSRSEAIAKIRGLSVEAAKEIMQVIDEESGVVESGEDKDEVRGVDVSGVES